MKIQPNTNEIRIQFSSVRTSWGFGWGSVGQTIWVPLIRFGLSNAVSVQCVRLGFGSISMSNMFVIWMCYTRDNAGQSLRRLKWQRQYWQTSKSEHERRQHVETRQQSITFRHRLSHLLTYSLTRYAMISTLSIKNFCMALPQILCLWKAKFNTADASS